MTEDKLGSIDANTLQGLMDRIRGIPDGSLSIVAQTTKRERFEQLQVILAEKREAEAARARLEHHDDEPRHGSDEDEIPPPAPPLSSTDDGEPLPLTPRVDARLAQLLQRIRAANLGAMNADELQDLTRDLEAILPGDAAPDLQGVAQHALLVNLLILQRKVESVPRMDDIGTIEAEIHQNEGAHDDNENLAAKRAQYVRALEDRLAVLRAPDLAFQVDWGAIAQEANITDGMNAAQLAEIIRRINDVPINNVSAEAKERRTARVAELQEILVRKQAEEQLALDDAAAAARAEAIRLANDQLGEYEARIATAENLGDLSRDVASVGTGIDDGDLTARRTQVLERIAAEPERRRVAEADRQLGLAIAAVAAAGDLNGLSSRELQTHIDRISGMNTADETLNGDQERTLANLRAAKERVDATDEYIRQLGLISEVGLGEKTSNDINGMIIQLGLIGSENVLGRGVDEGHAKLQRLQAAKAGAEARERLALRQRGRIVSLGEGIADLDERATRARLALVQEGAELAGVQGAVALRAALEERLQALAAPPIPEEPLVVAEPEPVLDVDQQTRLVVIEEVNGADDAATRAWKMSEIVTKLQQVSGFNVADGHDGARTAALAKLNLAFRNKLGNVLDNLTNTTNVSDTILTNLSARLVGAIAGLDEESMALKTQASVRIPAEVARRDQIAAEVAAKLRELSDIEGRIAAAAATHDALDPLRTELNDFETNGDPELDRIKNTLVDKVNEAIDKIDIPRLKPTPTSGRGEEEAIGTKKGEHMFAFLKSQRVFHYDQDDISRPSQADVRTAIASCFTKVQSASFSKRNRYIMKILIKIAETVGTSNRERVYTFISRPTEDLCTFLDTNAPGTKQFVNGC